MRSELSPILTPHKIKFRQFKRIKNVIFDLQMIKGHVSFDWKQNSQNYSFVLLYYRYPFYHWYQVTSSSQQV